MWGEKERVGISLGFLDYVNEYGTLLAMLQWQQ